jgi:hypothetical protein
MPFWKRVGIPRDYAQESTFTIINDPAWDIGPTGPMIYFDVDDGYVSANTSTLDTPDGLTIMMRVRCDVGSDNTGYRFPFQMLQNGTESVLMAWTHNTAAYRKVWYFNPDTVEYTNHFNADTWYTIGMSHDGTNTRVFRDGAFDRTEAASRSTTTPTQIYVGTNNAGSRSFQGDIEYCYVWPLALPDWAHRAIHNDPYGPFRPARRVVVRAPVAVGVPSGLVRIIGT